MQLPDTVIDIVLSTTQRGHRAMLKVTGGRWAKRFFGMQRPVTRSAAQSPQRMWPVGNYVNDNPINLGNSVNADRCGTVLHRPRGRRCAARREKGERTGELSQVPPSEPPMDFSAQGAIMRH